MNHDAFFTPELRIQKLSPDAILPRYATEGAAAMDLCAHLDAPCTIQPGERKLIPTALAIELPSKQYVAIICARSGLSIKHGLCLANGIGVIDSDYRGELRVALINLGDAPYTIQPNERIAQLMILPVCIASLCEVSALGDTERGSGGFGSTGKL